MLAAFVPACAELGYNPLDPDFQPAEELETLAQPTTLLNYKLPSLNDGVSLVERVYHKDTNILETRRVWKGIVADAPVASLVLFEATKDILPGVSGDPKEARGVWKNHNWRTIEFFDLYETKNAIGYVLWRRMLSGGRICVMFQQGWGGIENISPSHVLTGYYCSAPGEELTAGQAETVVQSVSVWEEN